MTKMKKILTIAMLALLACTAKAKGGQGENPVFRITKKYVPLNR